MVKPKGLNEGDNCSRNSWMSAIDFLVSFVQLALTQNLPAMLLGSTRLCNRKGKHSMSVAQATHVATGLSLMILIKPGPFRSISQKGKIWKVTHFCCTWVWFTHKLGRMWESWVFFPITAVSVEAALHYVEWEIWALPALLVRVTDICLMSPLQWNVYWLLTWTEEITNL